MGSARWLLGSAGAACLVSAQALGTPPVYAVRAIGLTGGVYTQSSSPGYAAMEINTVGPQGFVGGTSSRYSGSTQVGKDAWVYDGTASHVIDIVGPAYLEGGFPVPYRSETVLAINAQGRAVGTIGRHTSGGASSQGSDAWYWDGSTASIIGLMGVGYDQNPSSATTRRSNAAGGMNSAGWVFGGTARYANGSVTGTDAWLFDGTSTRVIGPSGAGYDYLMSGSINHWASVGAMNNAGTVVGNTDRYTGAGVFLGSDGWSVSGNTLSIIALTGGEFDRPSTAGAYHSTWPQFINDGGQIAGWVFRWNSSGDSLGDGAFLWTNGTFQVVDPTDTLHSKAVATGGRQRAPAVKALGENGVVVGESSRFDASGNSLGTDVWVFDGQQTRIIGLSGPNYQTPSNVPEDQARKTSAFVRMNAAGQITGWTASGNVSFTVANGWVYDIHTGVTMPIVPPPNSGPATPSAILPDGVVLGQYIVNRYPDGTGGYGKAFAWSPVDGFQDLLGLVGPGEGVQPWDHLTMANGGASSGSWPSAVGGYGSFAGVSGVFGYALVPVNQPGSFAPVSPVDGTSVGSLRPTLSWTPSTDAAYYTVYLSRNGGVPVSFTSMDTSAQVPAGLLQHCQHVSWSVKAGTLGVQTAATPAAQGFAVSSVGDFNQDGSTAIGDVFAFLNAWFAGAPEADFDGHNSLTVADVFAFLDAWFAGCS